MILEAGSDDLLAIEEIFRADEADDGIDQQRLEQPRDAIGAGFQRLLIAAVMRARRQRAALAGFEIHHIVADGSAP